MTKMKAITYADFGDPLVLSEIECPEMRPFEVLIQVAYVGVSGIFVLESF